ncbi:MAG: ABC transporter ATP-binding protein [bacterium]|nr:ABC transporter ATP-binding protein [bacterium]
MDAPPLLNDTAILVSNLSCDYPDGTTALRDVDLSIRRGASLALIGPNGAGKSSLLLCLVGLLPVRGDVYIAGEKLTPANAARLRRKTALVFQDPDDQLFMPALEEDVAFGPINLGLPDDEVQCRVERALTQVNLLDKRHKPPHHLSYGEKRRAALATALAMQADILLLDEPTSNLDAATAQELTAYLSEFPGTLIVATHELRLAKDLCQQCALLAEGKIVVSGATEDILRNEALLQQYRLLPR